MEMGLIIEAYMKFSKGEKLSEEVIKTKFLPFFICDKYYSEVSENMLKIDDWMYRDGRVYFKGEELDVDPDEFAEWLYRFRAQIKHMKPEEAELLSKHGFRYRNSIEIVKYAIHEFLELYEDDRGSIVDFRFIRKHGKLLGYLKDLAAGNNMRFEAIENEMKVIKKMENGVSVVLRGLLRGNTISPPKVLINLYEDEAEVTYKKDAAFEDVVSLLKEFNKVEDFLLVIEML